MMDCAHPLVLNNRPPICWTGPGLSQFWSRRHFNWSRLCTVSSCGSCQIMKLWEFTTQRRGVWGILWKYAFIRSSFWHTVVNIWSLFPVYFKWINISLIGQKSRRSSWQYRRALLLLDNPAQAPSWVHMMKLTHVIEHCHLRHSEKRQEGLHYSMGG